MSERFEKSSKPENEENKEDINERRRTLLKAALIGGGIVAMGAGLKYVEKRPLNMKKSHFENTEGARSFEEQFNTREKIETEGGTVETVDINQDAAGTPFLWTPAWACTMNVYEPVIKTLSEGGGYEEGEEDSLEKKEGKKEPNRVISLDYARFGGSGVSDDEAIKKYPEEFVRQSKKILGVLESKGIEKVNAVAHSMSSVSVVLAALANPEKFESITLFSPAGLKGKDTFTRLIEGFLGQYKGRPESMSTIPVTETEKKVGAVAGKEGAKYFAQNPYRALMEGIAMSKSDSQIHEALRYLHKKGVSICVIAPIDDPVFPMKDIQKIVKEDMLDGFLSVRGGHGAVGEHPELYIEAIKGIVKSMKKKREGEKEMADLEARGLIRRRRQHP